MSKVEVNTISNVAGSSTFTVDEVRAMLDAVGTDKGLATAWVKWDAIGTIIDSYNVSGVVRTALGRFTVTFTVPMDRDYLPQYSATPWSGTPNSDVLTTTLTEVTVASRSGSNDTDYDENVLKVHGGKN